MGKLMLIFLVIVSGILFSYTASRFVSKDAKLPDESYERYEKGVILVNFKKGINRDEIEDIFTKNNLSYRELNYLTILQSFLAKVNVPIGDEERWVKIFQEYPIVQDADLNFRSDWL